jgi:hypothetical protein
LRRVKSAVGIEPTTLFRPSATAFLRFLRTRKKAGIVVAAVT